MRLRAKNEDERMMKRLCEGGGGGDGIAPYMLRSWSEQQVGSVFDLIMALPQGA